MSRLLAWFEGIIVGLSQDLRALVLAKLSDPSVVEMRFGECVKDEKLLEALSFEAIHEQLPAVNASDPTNC